VPDIILDRIPRPRYTRGDVPIGFLPVYTHDSQGNEIARYRCTNRIRDLEGHIRQCSWVGKKSACVAHTRHTYVRVPDENPLVHAESEQTRNRARLNQRIVSIAGDFIAATNLSCRQAASPAMHEFIIALIQLGASLPRDQLNAIVDVPPLIDQITAQGAAEALAENANPKFQIAIAQLQSIHFVNLIVDAGTIYHLKSIPCLLTNPRFPGPPLLLALRENTQFTAGD
jgi:hypothetical protein